MILVRSRGWRVSEVERREFESGASASTMLNELGFDPDVVERQLAHQERHKVRAAYHRVEYIAERRTMMQRWADYVDGISSTPGCGG
jgi:transglutaminase-like putative cysteine protease